MSSHDFQQSNCADKVIVEIKQRLLHAFPNRFKPGKVYDSIEATITKHGITVTKSVTMEKREFYQIEDTSRAEW